MQIIKTQSRRWAGAGFGTVAASWGVKGRPDIRVLRDSFGWTAYIGTRKFFAITKEELEQELTTQTVGA